MIQNWNWSTSTRSRSTKKQKHYLRIIIYGKKTRNVFLPYFFRKNRENENCKNELGFAVRMSLKPRHNTTSMYYRWQVRGAFTFLRSVTFLTEMFENFSFFRTRIKFWTFAHVWCSLASMYKYWLNLLHYIFCAAYIVPYFPIKYW